MDIVIRAVIAFLFLLLLTRIVGRRELSSTEPFDLILLVVIGDLIQQGVTQSDYSLTGALLVGATFAVLTVLFSYLGFRVAPLRTVLEREPIEHGEDGQPTDQNLRRERLTLQEIAAEARLQKIAAIEDIRWAILEPNGSSSFIPKEG